PSMAHRSQAPSAALASSVADRRSSKCPRSRDSRIGGCAGWPAIGLRRVSSGVAPPGPLGSPSTLSRAPAGAAAKVSGFSVPRMTPGGHETGERNKRDRARNLVFIGLPGAFKRARSWVDALENRRGCKLIVGSNPTPSAIYNLLWSIYREF